jgi:enamine deaminase RidA (YjgF/YER057c/UK114 family)
MNSWTAIGRKKKSRGGIPNSMEWVPGGTGPETTQALRHIETILKECGASLDDIVKVNVFLADISKFSEMNAAYLAVMGTGPPGAGYRGACRAGAGCLGRYRLYRL